MQSHHRLKTMHPKVLEHNLLLIFLCQLHFLYHQPREKAFILLLEQWQIFLHFCWSGIGDLKGSFNISTNISILGCLSHAHTTIVSTKILDLLFSYFNFSSPDSIPCGYIYCRADIFTAGSCCNTLPC